MSNYQSKNFSSASKNTRIAIIKAEFNEDQVSELLQSSLEGFKKCEIKEENIDIFTVPGSLEIPAMIRFLQDKKIYDGFLALGIVIRGGTNHYEIVTEESSHALMNLSLQYSSPIINGILGGETTLQIEERLNKGKNFASGLITMIQLMK